MISRRQPIEGAGLCALAAAQPLQARAAAEGVGTHAWKLLPSDGGFRVWPPEMQPALCSRDKGRSWQPCEGGPAGDPLDHGTACLAPHGRGVMVGRPRGAA